MNVLAYLDHKGYSNIVDALEYNMIKLAQIEDTSVTPITMTDHQIYTQLANHIMQDKKEHAMLAQELAQLRQELYNLINQLQTS